jgi:integration host factor subunit beta
MNKSELIEKVSGKIEYLTKKQVETIVDMTFEFMKDKLSRGEKIELRDFGIFKIKERNARIARNPKTGEKVEVCPQKSIHFKMSKALKDVINR